MIVSSLALTLCHRPHLPYIFPEQKAKNGLSSLNLIPILLQLVTPARLCAEIGCHHTSCGVSHLPADIDCLLSNLVGCWNSVLVWVHSVSSSRRMNSTRVDNRTTIWKS